MAKIIEYVKGILSVSKTEVKEFLNHQKVTFSNETIQAIVNEINEKGLVVLENFYTPEFCQELIQDVNQKMSENKSYVWVDEVGADHRLFGIDRVSSLVKSFIENSFVQETMLAYLATSIPVNGFTLAGKIQATEKNLGSGGGWHRDTIYGKQFKAILYLTDTTEENGPFQYLEKTHMHGAIIDNILKNNIGASQSRFSENEIQTILDSGKYTSRIVTGKAGSLVLVDTTGIHRGMPIKKGERYALTNYYIEGPIPEIFNIVKPNV